MAAVKEVDNIGNSSEVPSDMQNGVQADLSGVSPTPPLEETPAPAPAPAGGGGVVANSGVVTGGNHGQDEAPQDYGNLVKTLGPMAVLVPTTLLTVAFTGNRPLSNNSRILRDFAVGSNVLGYISFFTILLIGHERFTGRAARILTAIAYGGAAFGFFAVMGIPLPDSIKLWISFLACAACIPGLVSVVLREE